MPVETYSENESDHTMTSETEPVVPPPPEVAGAEALDVPEQPSVTVRDRTFRLVSEIPGNTLVKFAAAQQRASRAANGGDGSEVVALLAVLDSMLRSMVIVEDQPGFDEWCETVSPPLGLREMMELPGKMMSAISVRPTQLF